MMNFFYSNRAALAGILLLLASGGLGAQEQELTQNLGGQWQFSPLDRREFSAPEFDDASWTPVTLPGELPGDLTQPNRPLWLRTTVNLAPEGANMALVLGRVWDMNQVYFNGTLIGDHWQERSAVHYNRPRIYTIPQDLIENGDNIIAIRLSGAFAGQIGLVEGPIEIRSVQSAEEELFLSEVTDLIYSATYLITGLFFIILFQRIPEFTEFRWYSAFAITFALQLFMRNEFRFVLGDFFLIFKYIEQLTYLALPVLFLYFFIDLFKIKFDRRLHGIAIVNALIGVAMLVLFDPVIWDTIIGIWFFINIPLFGYFLYITFRKAVFEGSKTGMIVFAGTIFMGFSAIHFFATQHGYLSGPSPFSLGTLIFNHFLSAALIYRLIRLQLEVRGRQNRLNTVNELRDRVIEYINSFVRVPAETIFGLFQSVKDDPSERPAQLTTLKLEVDKLQSNLDDILELSRLEVIDEPEYLEQVNFNDFINAVVPRDVITCHIKVNPEIVLNTSLELVNSIVIRLIDFPGFHDFRNIDLIITSDLKRNIHFRFLLFHPDFRTTRRLYDLLTTDTHDKSLWVKWAIIREIVRILSGDLKVHILNRKFLRIDIKLPADTRQKNLDMGKPADIKVHYVVPGEMTVVDGVETTPEATAVPVGAPETSEPPRFSGQMSVSDLVELIKYRLGRK